MSVTVLAPTRAPVRKVTAEHVDVRFTKTTDDVTLGVMAKGTLKHEIWTTYPNGVDHATKTEGVALVLTFYGKQVESPDDVARCLRALADAIEKATIV